MDAVGGRESLESWRSDVRRFASGVNDDYACSDVLMDDGPYLAVKCWQEHAVTCECEDLNLNLQSRNIQGESGGGKSKGGSFFWHQRVG